MTSTPTKSTATIITSIKPSRNSEKRRIWRALMKETEIIAISGCFQGMQVEGDAEQVGSRTTTAVVQAIFLVIVVDAFFAVFFSEIGWI